jgi:3-oxoacyl-[acyl-carrier-protein] synthase II
MLDLAVVGVGAITAAGNSVSASWERLAAGRPAVSLANGSDWPAELRSPVASINGRWSGIECRLDRSICLGISAAKQAIASVNVEGSPADEIDSQRCGVVFGSSKGGILSWTSLHREWLHDPSRRSDLHTFWDCVPPGAASRHVARAIGFNGPFLGISSACATGLHAIIRGAQMIQDGHADIVVAGAGDASIHPLIVSAFQKMKVAADCNGDPSAACKPFDLHRSGFVVGEGAGAMLIVRGDVARGRGWAALAHLRGYASGHDPTGIVRQDQSGETLADLVKLALSRARVSPAQVGCVSCHGTGTVANDQLEARAIKNVFGDAKSGPWATSVKGGVGHLLGAAGAVESALLVESLRREQALPTVNLTTPDRQCDINLVKDRTQSLRSPTGIALSMGFGGHLAAAVFSRVPN